VFLGTLDLDLLLNRIDELNLLKARAAVALYQIKTQELRAWNLDCFTRNVITGLITSIVSAQSTAKQGTAT